MNYQNQIDQLNRRTDTLRRANVASFGENFRRVMNSLRSSPIFGPIVEEIIESFPEVDTWLRMYVQGSQTSDLAELPPAQLAAVAISGLRELRNVSRIRDWSAKYYELSGQPPEAQRQREHDEGALQLAKDVLLEPLYDYLLEKAEEEQSKKEAEKESSNDTNLFSQEEKETITLSLNSLRDKLLKIADKSLKSSDEIDRVKRIVKEEIEELKAESGKLTKKDWKNHVIATIIGLVMIFASSVEARNTLVFSYEILIGIIYDERVDPNQIPPVDDTFLLQ